MPNTPHGAAIVFTASQVRAGTIGLTAVMVAVGIGGLATSLVADKPVPALRMAYTAAFTALLVFGLGGLVFIALRGQAAVIRHQTGIERVAIKHFAAIEEHQARIEQVQERMEATVEERAAKLARLIDDGLQDRLDQVEHLLLRVHDDVQNLNGTVERQSAVVSEVVLELGKHRDELSLRRAHRGG